ncbi:InlB B-repeat-containing protein, partial [Listeria monocytogenes]|nr:InlB B-repeat-containing protein [Listeria monocytogenes]
MIDFGKINEVIGYGQLKDVTIDVDWSEEVTIAAPGNLLMEAMPVLSKPISSYGDFYSGFGFLDTNFLDDLGITWEDIVDYPNSGMEWDKSKIGLKNLKNVDQTINMHSFMQSSLPGNGLDMRIGADFKVRINQVSKKVTFDNEGIESSNQIPVTDLIKEPTTPTKQGYAFLGWYDARSGGTKWDFVTDKMPNKDMTLYAQYSKQSYKVIFDNAGNKNEKNVQFETLVKEPTAPTKQGYTFTGWYDAETGGTKWDFKNDKMPASDLTLYARY